MFVVIHKLTILFCVKALIGISPIDKSRISLMTLPREPLAADPRNPVALKNRGSIPGKEGDSLRALYYLRRSFWIDPQDPQTMYVLAFAA